MRVIGWKDFKNQNFGVYKRADREAMMQYLAGFWRQFNNANKTEKLRLLKSAASRYFGGCRKQNLSNRRKFNNKKKKFDWGLCLVCGVHAELLHHVIQIQNGGHNHRKNLAPLCNDCHAEIHPWLKVTANV